MLTPEELTHLFSKTLHTWVSEAQGTAIRQWGVAVSGGADSMATALLLKYWLHGPHTMRTVTVDHGLRPESAHEAQQVQTWMAHHDIPHDIVSCAHLIPPHAANQKRAREARYHVLREWSHRHNIHILMTGHHADDQIETLLMRLDHGTGLQGMGCMRSQPSFNQGSPYRPLLNVRHASLVNYLRAHQQDWIEDPSNQNPRFSRTRYRAMLHALETNGWQIPSVLISLQKLQAHLQCLQEDANAFLKSVTMDISSHAYRLDRIKWNQGPHVLKKQAMTHICQSLHPRPYLPKSWEIKYQTLSLFLEKGEPGRSYTLAGCLFRLRKKEILIQPEDKGFYSP